MRDSFGGSLVVLESVLCLDCGEIYSKPSHGGTAVTNPGCPACGYAGWIPLAAAPARRRQHRSAADPPPHRLARRG
jgi:predicted  nucleic acid-binding Zn-ribbon protein